MDIIKDKETGEVETKASRRKKQKPRKHNDTPTPQSSKEIKTDKSDETKINKTTTNKRTKESSLAINKKKIFDNDDAEEVEKTSNSKKKKINDDEGEINDEDIDKFCEELDEEDNKQYENWVKLFETNFRSGKKKT